MFLISPTAFILLLPDDKSAYLWKPIVPFQFPNPYRILKYLPFCFSRCCMYMYGFSNSDHSQPSSRHCHCVPSSYGTALQESTSYHHCWVPAQDHSRWSWYVDVVFGIFTLWKMYMFIEEFRTTKFVHVFRQHLLSLFVGQPNVTYNRAFTFVLQRVTLACPEHF